MAGAPNECRPETRDPLLSIVTNHRGTEVNHPVARRRPCKKPDTPVALSGGMRAPARQLVGVKTFGLSLNSGES